MALTFRNKDRAIIVNVLINSRNYVSFGGSTSAGAGSIFEAQL